LSETIGASYKLRARLQRDWPQVLTLLRTHPLDFEITSLVTYPAQTVNAVTATHISGHLGPLPLTVVLDLPILSPRDLLLGHCSIFQNLAYPQAMSHLKRLQLQAFIFSSLQQKITVDPSFYTQLPKELQAYFHEKFYHLGSAFEFLT
jgi:hypothetical protein